MKHFLCSPITLLVIISITPATASADIIVTSSVTVDRAGHELDGTTFSVSGTIAPATSWVATSIFRRAAFPASELNVTGSTFAGFNGSYTTSGGLEHWSATSGSHFGQLAPSGDTPLWINGTHSFKHLFRVADTSQDAAGGDVVSLLDVNDHYGAGTFASAAVFYAGTGPGYVDLAGAGDFVGTSHGATTAAVPEPSTFALLGVGAIGLIGYRRRKQKQVA